MCVLLYSFLFLYIVCLWIVNLVVAEFVCAMPEYYLFIFQKKKLIEKETKSHVVHKRAQFWLRPIEK